MSLASLIRIDSNREIDYIVLDLLNLRLVDPADNIRCKDCRQNDEQEEDEDYFDCSLHHCAYFYFLLVMKPADYRYGSQAVILPQIFRGAAIRCVAAPQSASGRVSQNGHKQTFGVAQRAFAEGDTCFSDVLKLGDPIRKAKRHMTPKKGMSHAKITSKALPVVWTLGRRAYHAVLAAAATI